jgi:DNA-binding MurR/RpiR family transcriptional regulator
MMKAQSVLLLGNSTVARELATRLGELGTKVRFVTTTRDAFDALQSSNGHDLLAVEITAVGFGELGLTDLAAVARERDTRLALITSRSVADIDACASLLGAVGSVNKWAPVGMTARRLSELAIHAPRLEQGPGPLGWSARMA